jgi:hypothetical protein
MDDQITLKGRLRLELRGADGLPKATQDIPNLIVLAGKSLVSQRLCNGTLGPITHMAIGSNAGAEGAGQTTLLTQTAIVALTSATPTSNQATFVGVFGAGVGTGTIAEAGLFTAISAGTMLSRTTSVSLTKGSTDTLTVTWIVTVN